MVFYDTCQTVFLVNVLFIQSFIRVFNHFVRVAGTVGAYPSSQRARGGAYPGQADSSSPYFQLFSAVICQSLNDVSDEVVSSIDSWWPPAREQVNPVLQGCIMISQGAMRCSSLYGASFLGLWCYSSWALTKPYHLNTSYSPKARGRFCKAMPCHFPTNKTQSNGTRNNIGCHLIEKPGYIWESGEGRKYMWQRGEFLIGSGHVGEVSTCVCVRVCVSGSECGIILKNFSL